LPYPRRGQRKCGDGKPSPYNGTVITGGGDGAFYLADRQEDSKRQKTDLVEPFFCLGSAVDCYEVFDGSVQDEPLWNQNYPGAVMLSDELTEMSGHGSEIMGDEYAVLVSGHAEHGRVPLRNNTRLERLDERHSGLAAANSEHNCAAQILICRKLDSHASAGWRRARSNLSRRAGGIGDWSFRAFSHNFSVSLRYASIFARFAR